MRNSWRARPTVVRRKRRVVLENVRTRNSCQVFMSPSSLELEK
jgi:hypothetical protein